MSWQSDCRGIPPSKRMPTRRTRPKEQALPGASDWLLVLEMLPSRLACVRVGLTVGSPSWMLHTSGSSWLLVVVLRLLLP